MVGSDAFDAGGFWRLRSSAPVLIRGAREVQVGFDQDEALVLTDVDPTLARVLAMLDGYGSLREVRSWGERLGVTRSTLDWALETLRRAGLLERVQPGEPTGRAPAGARLRLVGAGRIGRCTAELLCASGVSALDIVDTDPVDPGLYPSAGALGSQAEALRHALGARAGPQITVVNHFTKPDGVTPDLTIVFSERVECDRVMAEGLVRADQPHLIVRVRPGAVLVGPLVLPGRTACLRCTDLTRRDRDPAWPTLLTQLCRSRVPVTPALAAWAAAVAATQVLATLHGGTAETGGATLELSCDGYRTSRRSWPMHPGCGCGWGATAQWGA